MPPSPLKQLKDIPTIAHLYRSKALKPVSSFDVKANQEFNNKICTIQYDLTKLQVDAIVNAANRRLLGGGGVDGAIHMAAGPQLLEECKTLNGCAPGSAKITDAYKLPCKKVIHAVGPIYDNEEASQPLLRGCYRTALQLAVENDCKSVAFSAISTGIYGYPSDLAAKAALREVLTFLNKPEGKQLDKVIFCSFLDKDVDAYAKAIPEIFPPTEEDLSEAVSATLESQPILESFQEDKVGDGTQTLQARAREWKDAFATNADKDFEEGQYSPRDASKEGRVKFEKRQELGSTKEKLVEEPSRQRVWDDQATLDNGIPGPSPTFEVTVTTNRSASRTDIDERSDNSSIPIATTHSEVEDEKVKTRNSTSAGVIEEGERQSGQYLGDRFAMTTYSTTIKEVENMMSGGLSTSIRLKVPCDHEWHLDNGTKNFNLWPKDRLWCSRCHAVRACRFF